MIHGQGATGDLTTREDGKSSEFVAWSAPRGGAYLPTEVAYDGALYVLSETGILSRFDAKTGKLNYRSRLDGGGAFTSPPWADNGKVFCLSEEGKTFVIAAGASFELLRINLLDEMARAPPAIETRVAERGVGLAEPRGVEGVERLEAKLATIATSTSSPTPHPIRSTPK